MSALIVLVLVLFSFWLGVIKVESVPRTQHKEHFNIEEGSIRLVDGRSEWEGKPNDFFQGVNGRTPTLKIYLTFWGLSSRRTSKTSGFASRG